MDSCILTNYGRNLILQALSAGTSIDINTVQLGSSNNFTLEPSLATIPDIVYTTTDNTNVLSSVILGNDTMEFRIYLGTNIGTFNVGGIAVCDSTGGLIMAAKLDVIARKVATTEEETGNTFQFKLPINLTNVSQLVTSIGTQFFVDGTTIRLNSNNELSSAIVPHHVFDIFQNASTQPPLGAFPMWTGEIIYCEGSREEFYAKALDAMSNNYIRVITNAEYQQEITTNGWTNAFVIDTTVKSVRLPTYKGILCMDNPTTTVTDKAGSSSGSYGFINVPTYIQVDTAAVPATMAQCDAFTQSLRNFATQFVTLSTTQIIDGNKTWTGTNDFTGNVTTQELRANGAFTSAGGMTVSGGLTVSSNGTFSGSTYTAGGSWTFTDTIQGTTYRALWADIAERYLSDKEYVPGTLIEFGGSKEITIAKNHANGIISKNPAFLLNDKKVYDDHSLLPVALAGQTPVRVIGAVSKFDNLILSNKVPGVAIVADSETDPYKIIGKALEDNLDEGEKLVNCVVKFNIL